MPSIVTMHEDGRTPEGVYDLAGNVMEWTLDAFLPYSARRMQTPPDEPRRAVRGGAFDSRASALSSTARKGLFPETQAPNLGFRCVFPER
jgi:formylglycine-generating enzyme required for sulfatase activity